MSNARFKWECVRCKKEFVHGKFLTKCDACGGLIDVDYDPKRVEIRPTGDLLDRYGDILPIQDSANYVRLGLTAPTPCVHAKRLGKLLGLENLFLKDETKNPTGTTKDRTATVVLSWLKEVGVTHFTSTATGNSSTAFARACIENPPFEHSVFIASRWHDRLTWCSHPRVHVWILEGANVVEAIAYSRKWEKENGIPSEGGFFNPGRREGLKLAFLEAVDETRISFDWYFQGVSTAMGLFGTFKGARLYEQLGRIDRLPRLGGIQEETCSPQVRAFKDDSPVIEQRHIFETPDGIADALLKGNPSDTYPYMYEIVKRTGGLFESVTAKEIATARRAIMEYEGIPACNASSTTIAGIKKLLAARRLDPKARILASITGSDRDPRVYPRRYKKLVRAEDRWVFAGIVNEEPEADATT
jgi:threonine synthase